MHPYNPGYFSGSSGMNCLQWNMYWDFGSGQVGDMGSHTMDLVWNALDLKLPDSAEAKGDPFHPDVTPVMLEASWEFTRPGKEKPLSVSWYQGGALPRQHKSLVDLSKIGHGAMFRGDKGMLICDFDNRVILPSGPQADMTYYKPRDAGKLIPGIENFQGEWVKACKGEGKTSCDFEYAGNMIEMMLLGLVAYRAGKKLKYDAASMSTDDSQANQFLRRSYRDGWPLVG
jgi:predicted dehydrogenase